MSLGAVIIPLVFVKSEVEFRSVLNNRFIQRREKHMILIVQVGNGYHHQTVIFPDVATHESGVAISAGPIGYQQFLKQGILQVGHLRFIKS